MALRRAHEAAERRESAEDSGVTVMSPRAMAPAIVATFAAMRHNAATTKHGSAGEARNSPALFNHCQEWATVRDYSTHRVNLSQSRRPAMP